MDFKKLLNRYRQFGGLCLIWTYFKLGALPVVVKGFVSCLIKRQSFKAIYPEVLKRVEPFLTKRFQVSRFKIQANELPHEHPKVIWWCWLQGLDEAPQIVKACYASLVQEFKGSKVQEGQGISGVYEIKVIDAENWKEYIELPGYIVKKWEKKQIPPALFSDLLRLELLIKYGGTWIDSTVLCTGFKEFESLSSSCGSSSSPSVQEFKKYLEADLFLFQYTPEGTIKDISISNWFISAHSNNKVLMTLRDMLFAYWKDYNCTLDYYIFHLFFAMIAKEYPEQIAAIPYGYSMNSLVLLHHWGEQFEQKKWDKLTENVCFHKLAYRIRESVKDNKNNYYNKVLEQYK